MSDEIKDVETIHGFDIPKRQLTPEEAARPITLERFNDFHYEVGEDFVDQCESMYDHKVFCGWCMHKYPELSKDIIAVINGKYGGVQGILHLFEKIDSEKGCDKFYTDFAEFLNQTEIAKGKTNQVLIQIQEYYNS